MPYLAVYCCERNAWRLARSCIPAAHPYGVCFVITIVGFYQQSNLWPLILILVSPLGFLYLVILLVSHSFLVRGKNEEQKQI